jgi:hypothetical protein
MFTPDKNLNLNKQTLGLIGSKQINMQSTDTLEKDNIHPATNNFYFVPDIEVLNAPNMMRCSLINEKFFNMNIIPRDAVVVTEDDDKQYNLNNLEILLTNNNHPDCKFWCTVINNHTCIPPTYKSDYQGAESFINFMIDCVSKKHNVLIGNAFENVVGVTNHTNLYFKPNENISKEVYCAIHDGVLYGLCDAASLDILKAYYEIK